MHQNNSLKSDFNTHFLNKSTKKIPKHIRIVIKRRWPPWKTGKNETNQRPVSQEDRVPSARFAILKYLILGQRLTQITFESVTRLFV